MNAKYAFVDNNSGFLFFVQSAATPEAALEAGLRSIGEYPKAARRDGQASYYDCYDVSGLEGAEAFDGQDAAAIAAVRACPFVSEYVGERAQ